MQQYFAYDYTGTPFIQLGIAHIAAILVLFTFALTFYFSPHRCSLRSNIRYVFAALLVINELGWHTWHAYYGLWSLQTMLPLNICNLMVFASAWTLVTKNQTGYEFIYLLGIPAASQVLITPALGIYGFPHLLFFQIFISHGGIVLAALYLTWVYGMRPKSWRSVGRVAGWSVLYVIIIFLLNQVLESNYLFLAYKPPATTLLDYLGPWPWYIFSMVAIGALLLVLLYLPFALSIRRKTAHTRTAAR